MKLEHNSKNVLAATKSIARFHELGVDINLHTANFQDPQDLLVLTIGILGELAAIERRLVDTDIRLNEKYNLLKSQLTLVAQYFDALDNSKAALPASAYLKIVGSAAYYLADMPGSASVLAQGLAAVNYGLTNSSIEGPLIWLLKDPPTQPAMVYCTYKVVNEVAFDFVRFANQTINEKELLDSCIKAQVYVYDIGTDRDLFFMDLIVAIVKRRARNSSINCLPKFTGLDISAWKGTLQKSGFIKEFWPAQRLLGERGILAGRSGVIQMPTSAGKSKSTELILRSAFLAKRADLAVIVAPFRALCRELTSVFTSAFVDEPISINELLDIPQVDERDADFLKFLLGDKFRDPKENKTLLISTPEKLVYLLRQKPEIAKRIGVIIFDEGHQFDNDSRGVTYELLVASLRAAVAPETQIVLISAVIGNAKTIGEWLYGENGVEIQGANCIPTLRSIAFASWTEATGQLNYLDPESIHERDYMVPNIIDQINFGTRGKQTKSRLFPDRTKPTSIPGYLGVRLCGRGPTAVFCGTKINANAICKHIVDAYEKGLSIPPPLASSDINEITRIKNLAIAHFGVEDLVTRSVALGVLPHSAGVPNGIRVSVEWAMEKNKASLVVCTSTLSQGVNLPIKYLVVSSTTQAGEEIKKRDFHNLIGRAGRSGYHTEGSVIFSDVKIFENRFGYKGQHAWRRALELLDTSISDDCVSSLKELVEPLPVVSADWDVLEFVSNTTSYEDRFLQGYDENSDEFKILSAVLRKNVDIVQKIESYMLSYYKDNPGFGTIEVFGKLAERTLAFHLSDNAERDLLVSVFKKIGENVLAIDTDKIAYYGKALLGISELLRIESWALENRFVLELCEDELELLDCCWSLIEILVRHSAFRKYLPKKALREVARGWIGGKCYRDLLRIFESHGTVSKTPKREAKISMLNVVDFTEHALGYESMLVVGTLADIVEGNFKNEDLAEKVRSLQSSLKIGLNSEFEKWLYGRGFTDREVCKSIAFAYSQNGTRENLFDANILRANPVPLLEILDQFPTYFSEVKH